MMRDHASGPRLFRTPWFMPLFCLALGALTAGALALGGQRSSAVFSLILFAVIAAVLALGGRSETVRQFRGDGRDERWARIDLAATALCGLVLITVIIAACFYECNLTLFAQSRAGAHVACAQRDLRILLTAFRVLA